MEQVSSARRVRTRTPYGETGAGVLTDGATAFSRRFPTPEEPEKEIRKRRNVDTRPVHGLQWVLLPYALNKYGYRIEGSGPTWKKVQPRHREAYRHIAFRSKFLGFAWEKYHTIAREFSVSDSTAERWMRELHHMGLVLMENRFVKREDTGAIEYTSNAYWPQSALSPGGDALAVVYRGKLTVLTQMPMEIPPIPGSAEALSQIVSTARGQGKPQAGTSSDEERIATLDARIAKLEARKKAIEEGQTTLQPAEPKRTPLVVLPRFYKQMAESMGVRDLLEQSEAWDAFQKARQAGKIKKTEGGAGGYFRVILENRQMQKAIDAAMSGSTAGAMQAGMKGNVLPSVQSTLNLPVITPAHALALRDAFLQGEALRLLGEGHSPIDTAHRLIRHPHLARYDRYVAEALDLDWLSKMIEEQIPRAAELKQQVEARNTPKPRSVASTPLEEWLIRRRDEIRAQGPMAPGLMQIAEQLAYAPDRPEELRRTTPEQVRDLLKKLG